MKTKHLEQLVNNYRTDLVKAMKIDQSAIAKVLNLSRQKVNGIIKKRIEIKKSSTLFEYGKKLEKVNLFKFDSRDFKN